MRHAREIKSNPGISIVVMIIKRILKAQFVKKQDVDSKPAADAFSDLVLVHFA